MNMHIDGTKTEACVGGIHGVSRGPGHLPAIDPPAKRFLLAQRPEPD
jgi:hypothetical protein